MSIISICISTMKEFFVIACHVLAWYSIIIFVFSLSIMNIFLKFFSVLLALIATSWKRLIQNTFIKYEILNVRKANYWCNVCRRKGWPLKTHLYEKKQSVQRFLSIHIHSFMSTQNIDENLLVCKILIHHFYLCH